MLENMPDDPRTAIAAIAGGAKRKSQLAFACNAILRVNAREPGMEGQTKIILTGEMRCLAACQVLIL
jgi:hypothetical protein